MPTIDNFELPEFLTEELVQRVEIFPDKAILMFAKSFPEKFSGFRIIKNNCEQFRSRIIKSIVSEGQELPDELGQLFACNSVNEKFIAELPVESLELFHQECLDIFGPEYFLNCMLLDGRHEVRKIAIDWVKEFEKYIEEGDKDDLIPDEGEVPEAVAQELQDAKKMLKEAKIETTAERKKNKKLQKKIDALVMRCAKHKENYSEKKRNAASLNDELIEKQREMDHFQKNFKEEVRKGIDAHVGQLTDSWLTEPLQVHKIVKERSSDLVGRVNEALVRQAQKDKHSGNIKALKERLIVLEQAKTDIDNARKDALQPLPELASLSCELSGEIEKIQDRITIKPRRDNFLTSWQAQINEASSPDEIHKISELLQNLYDLKFIPKNNYDILRKLVCHTRDRLVDSNTALFRTFIAKLKPKKEQLTFIVDGHNVILGPDSYYLFNGQSIDVPEHEKRKLLVNLNKKAFQKKTDTAVVIFFDSPEHSEKQVAANIKEIYSGGGQEDQRADKAIIQYLHEAKIGSPKRKNVLVTDDRELALNAQNRGAQTMSVFEYGIMLR